MKFDGPVATVAGYPAATAAVDRLQLAAGCTPTVKRADQHLVSIVWKCGDSLTAATVTLGGRRLVLGDILQGDYASYLSSVASAQFSAAGQADAPTNDLGTWFLTPAALAVDFPAGVVSYPLASLGPYLRDPSSL